MGLDLPVPRPRRPHRRTGVLPRQQEQRQKGRVHDGLDQHRLHGERTAEPDGGLRRLHVGHIAVYDEGAVEPVHEHNLDAAMLGCHIGAYDGSLAGGDGHDSQGTAPLSQHTQLLEEGWVRIGYYMGQSYLFSRDKFLDYALFILKFYVLFHINISSVSVLDADVE